MIQGEKVIVDLYILSMIMSNIVLGTQWTRTVGPIITDYKELFMSFQVKGRIVKWKAESNILVDPLFR